MAKPIQYCKVINLQLKEINLYLKNKNKNPQFNQRKKKKKNTFESVLTRWVKLEPIIQSEVSQKEKHQYSILTHIYGI